jgi:hypothetical protein
MNMGRAKGGAQATRTANFNVVMGRRRGPEPGFNPWGDKLNETGQERVKALCEKVYRGDIKDAVLLLAEHGKIFRKRPGIIAVSQALAMTLLARTRDENLDFARTLSWKMGVAASKAEASTPKNPLPNGEYERVQQSLLKRVLRQVIPTLVSKGLDDPDDDFVVLRRVVKNIFREESASGLARLAAADSKHALQNIYGGLYEGLCADLGWEEPAELLGLRSWKRIAVEASKAVTRHDVQREVRRELGRLARNWTAENLSTRK